MYERRIVVAGMDGWRGRDGRKMGLGEDGGGVDG